MAYQKLQPGRSRTYFPSTFSDTVDNVALNNNISLGQTQVSGTPGVLNSSINYFFQDKVQPGDLVLNATTSSRGQSTLVKQVISDTELILQDADAIFFPSNFFFITPPPSEPAVLNVQQTTAGGISLKITTSGGDDLTFVGLQSGSYLPVQTTRIWETVGDNIIENGSFRSGSNLIQNGSFNEIGPELVTNGDFSATGTEEIVDGGFPNGSTAWNLGNGGTIVDNEMQLDCGGTTDAYTYQSKATSYTSGKSYKLTVKIVSNTTGTDLILYAGGFSPNTVNISIGTTPNTYSIYFVADYTSGSGSTIVLRAFSSTGIVVIDNVSVQEVGADWVSLNPTNTFGEHGLTMTSTLAADVRIRSGGGIVANSTSYKVTYTIHDVDLTGTNAIQYYTGSNLNGYDDLPEQDEGTHTFYYTTPSTITSTFWFFRLDLRGTSTSTTDFVTISSISVKEIAPYWTVTNSDSTHYVNFPTGYAQLIAATDSPQVQLEQNVLDATGLKSYEINCNIDYGQGSNLILNGDFSATGADLVLDGNFPLPNDNWIIAASTTINGGSATFGGLGAVTEAEMLLASFVVRVEADGGVVEAQTCLASDLTFLTENP